MPDGLLGADGSSWDEARRWVHGFVSWYNQQHRHSGIRFVTPAERHEDKDNRILKRRHEVYQAAKERHPEHWSSNMRNWDSINEVWLNPPKEKYAKELKRLCYD